MKLKLNTLLSILLITAASLNAQDRLMLNGYLKAMESAYLLENPIPLGNNGTGTNLSYHLIHNRLNFKAFPASNTTMALEVRNRLFSGKLIEALPSYADMVDKDDGLIDLSWNIHKAERYFFNTTIDRLYVDYMQGDWQLRLGRQRINWGINLVWNPNDLFNAFSFTDFDYEERPGSDAVLITWYPTFSSSVDLVYKAASQMKQRALAAKYRFNHGSYDFQLIGGQYGNDWVLGGGWSGYIHSISFRGEWSYFHPLPGKSALSESSLSTSLSFDYTFENSIYLHTSFLFNSQGTTEKGNGISLLDPTFELSAKNLSVGKYELFGQLSWPVNPLLTAGIAAMLNPADQSMYLGPSLQFSLSENIGLFFMSQLTLGETGSEYAAMGRMYAFYGRLQWSF